MNGRDKYAARLAKAKKKAEAEKAKGKGGGKQAFTDSHLKLHKHERDGSGGPYEKFSWEAGDVLEARNGTKFELRKELFKCAFYQEILCHITGDEEESKPKKAVLKVINAVPDRIYPEGRKVDEEEIVSLIASAGDSPALAQSTCIFMHKCFHVMAFEPYSIDLTSYLGDDPTEVRYLRFILRQVLDGMRCLERLGIIHGDLRGTNIRLLKKDHIRVRIRITGFQFAQFKSDVVQGSILQTADSRAPEVIVGGEITEAIDTWSVACTFSYQNTMEDAFQGQTPLHILWSIVEQQGELPDWLLDSGLYTKHYYEKRKDKWHLKEINEPVYVAENTPDAAVANFGEAHELDESMFWELIGQMMDPDPKKRITAAKALEHPFITMAYLNIGVSAIKYSRYAKMCAELVDPSLPFSHYYIRKAAEDFAIELLSPDKKKKKKTEKEKSDSSNEDD